MQDPLPYATIQLPVVDSDEKPVTQLQKTALFDPSDNRQLLRSLEGSFDGFDGNHDAKRTDSMISADRFDETGYLSLHPDVQKAIERGDVESGYKHYALYGSAENRALP